MVQVGRGSASLDPLMPVSFGSQFRGIQTILAWGRQGRGEGCSCGGGSLPMFGPGSRGRVEMEDQKQGWTRNCKALCAIHFFLLSPSPLKVPQLPNIVPLAVAQKYKCEPMRDTSHAIPSESSYCCLCVYGYRAIHWGTGLGNVPGTIPQMETDSPSSLCLPTAPQLRAWSHRPSGFHAGILAGLVSYREAQLL